MTVKMNPNGGVPMIEVGPPVRKEVIKVKGRPPEVKWMPVPHDDHTHIISYERSQSVQLQTMNTDIANLVAQVKTRQSPPEPKG